MYGGLAMNQNQQIHYYSGNVKTENVKTHVAIQN